MTSNIKVASKTLEIEISMLALVLVVIPINASRWLNKRNSSTLVFNTEVNALLVTLPEAMVRDQKENAT